MFEMSGFFGFLVMFIPTCAILSGVWRMVQAARKRPFVLEQYLAIGLVVATGVGQMYGGAGSLLLMAAVPALVFSTACMVFYLAVQSVIEKPVTQRGVELVGVLISVPAVVFPGIFILTFARGMFGGDVGWLWIGALVLLGWVFGRIISAVWLHFLYDRISKGGKQYGP